MFAMVSRYASVFLFSLAVLAGCQFPDLPPIVEDGREPDASETPVDAPGGVTLVVTPMDVTVTEGSQSTFMVSLSGAPSSMVSVALDPSDPAKLGVTPFQLFFGPSDWSTPQTVTVSGREDADAENESETVTVGSVLGNVMVNVTVTDNDTVRIVASPSAGLDVNEGGGATLNVRLGAQPASSVVVTASSSDQAIATVAPTSLTFTAQNWNINQSVSVSGVSDVDTVNNNATISLASTGLTTVGVPIQVIDDDVLGIAPSSTNLGAITEGGATSFTVTLTQQPSASVTVAVASSDVTIVTATPASMSFTTANWNVAQTVSVTAPHDQDVANETGSISLNASGLAMRTVAASVTDDDIQTIVAAPSPLPVDEGGTRALNVRLAYQPSSPVALSVTSLNTSLATAAPSTLSFTAANYMTNQTVTVTGVEDVDAASASTAVRLESVADGLLSDIPVNVTDNDQLTIETSVPSVSLAESGSTMFGVRLTAMPSMDVVVNVSSGDATAAAVAPTALTFTSANWSTYQNVVVSGVADVDLANESLTINLAATGVPARTVDATVTDDDMQIVVASSPSVSINEGSTGTVGINLGFIPAGNVTVTLTTADTGVATVSPPTLTFTPGNYATAQNITLAGVNDVDTIDDSTTLSAAASGATSAMVAVTVNDDDSLGIDTSVTTVSIGENGTGMVGVRLTAQPAANVTVNIASSDTGAATVSTGSVTFTTSNWMTYQNVSLAGVSDDDAEDESVTVSLTSTGLTMRTVTVSVADDDTQAVIMGPSSLALTEGGSGTVNVHLAYRPLTPATVTVMSGNASVATVAPSTLTFTSANYTMDQSVTVTAPQDADTSPASTSISTTLTGASTGSTTVSVTDDDFIPTIPVLSKPLNGAYVGSALNAGTRRPKFVWRPSTVMGSNPLTYELQYSTDATFAIGSTSVTGITQTEYQPTGDLTVNTATAPKGTRYFWRTRACAGPVCSAYSARYMVNVGRSDHDINGDGYADLVVIARFADVGGVDNGKAYVFFGPTLAAGSAVKVIGANGDRLANAVEVADFNGDGFSDVALGTSGDDSAGADAGTAAIYLGSAAFNTTADFQVYGFAPNDRMGRALASGDFNADGFDDLAVGTELYDPPGDPDQGRVDVFYGAATLDSTSDRNYQGSNPRQLGTDFSLGAADTNGDGFEDLLIVEREFNPINGFYNYTDRVHFGASSGPSSSTSLTRSGYHLTQRAGDVNSDGYEDIVVAGFLNPGILVGTATGPSATLNGFATPPDWNGSSVLRPFATLGDINRDGYDDVALGEPTSPTSTGGGQFWVYFGGSTFDGSSDTTFTGTGGAGTSVCGGADVNGDGTADFADGATGETGSASVSGRTHIFFGSSPFVNTEPDIITSGETSQESFGGMCSL